MYVCIPFMALGYYCAISGNHCQQNCCWKPFRAVLSRILKPLIKNNTMADNEDMDCMKVIQEEGALGNIKIPFPSLYYFPQIFIKLMFFGRAIKNDVAQVIKVVSIWRSVFANTRAIGGKLPPSVA